jgi:O-antigen ligase
VWGGSWREAAASLPSRTLIVAVAAWFALTALSLAWTIDARHTLEELRAESLYGALALAVFYVLARDPARWRTWWIAIMAGTALTLAARWLQSGLGIALWRHSPDGGVGAFSTHLVLVAPVLVALVCDPPWGFRRAPRWIAVALVALIAAAWTTRDVATTPNRIVWPSLGLVFVVAAISARRASGFQLSDGPAMRRVLVGGALALALAFTASIAVKSERFYPDEAGIGTSLEHDLRPHLWSVAREEIRKAPWIGHGFGREILSNVFLPHTPKSLDHPPVMHAHNTFLNIALQLGIIGVAIFLGMLFLFAREYVAMLGQASVAPLGVMGLALLAGFVTKNFTDDFFHRHNAHVFWALNGMLLGFAQRLRAG